MAKRKIRMLVSMVGPEISWQIGDELNLDEPLARALCAEPPEAPRAEPVGWKLTEKKMAQTATREQREKAVIETPDRR